MKKRKKSNVRICGTHAASSKQREKSIPSTLFPQDKGMGGMVGGSLLSDSQHCVHAYVTTHPQSPPTSCTIYTLQPFLFISLVMSKRITDGCPAHPSLSFSINIRL